MVVRQEQGGSGGGRRWRKVGGRCGEQGGSGGGGKWGKMLEIEVGKGGDGGWWWWWW